MNSWMILAVLYLYWAISGSMVNMIYRGGVSNGFIVSLR